MGIADLGIADAPSAELTTMVQLIVDVHRCCLHFRSRLGRWRRARRWRGHCCCCSCSSSLSVGPLLLKCLLGCCIGLIELLDVPWARTRSVYSSSRGRGSAGELCRGETTDKYCELLACMAMSKSTGSATWVLCWASVLRDGFRAAGHCPREVKWSIVCCSRAGDTSLGSGG